MNQELIAQLQGIIKGEIDVSADAKKKYSRDASLFEIEPQIVVFPKDSADIQAVVAWVAQNKAAHPELAITMRSAGTDMSGGAIGPSIIIDVTRYLNKIISVTPDSAVVQPGVYYRDFEKETLKINRIMPAYTASKEICTVGGMVANNSGGEKTLKYGKTERYIQSLKVIFVDGKEYEVKPLSQVELQAKINSGSFDSDLYKKLWDLIQANKKQIMAAKPTVSKNSAGYYLWNVYDEKTGTFDLCKLICGSQGTLGIVTEITFSLVPVQQHENILAIFLPNLNHVSELVTEILPFGPDSLETFDDYSLKLAIRFFFDFYKQMGLKNFVKLGFQFLPEMKMTLTGGIPKLIIMVEATDVSEQAVREKLLAIQKKIAHFGYQSHVAQNSFEAEKYWRIRHESFNLLRKHVKGLRTAPFIDDIIVKPEHLPEFLPKVQAILDQYKLIYTVAGHAGDGNFHIIPLMDLESPFSIDAILEISQKVYTLVLSYQGSVTAEHNDGIIRTPYLMQMFGAETVALFEQTKKIFDPANILNPGKKVGGTFEDIKKYLIRKN